MLMKKTVRLGVLISAMILLGGCAGASIATRQSVRFPDQTKTVEDPEMARIYVLRESGAGSFTFLVRDGKKRIGSTNNGGFLCWERPPGNVIISSDTDNLVDSLNLQVQKNTAYYVKQAIALQAFGHARTSLTLLSQEEGVELVKDYSPPIANAELAGPIKASSGPGIDLTRYQVVTVVPFGNDPGKNIDGEIGSDFADEIHEVLKNSFGPIFREVRFGTPTGAADELVITGTIKAYDPGSRGARLQLIGLGAASFDADVSFVDSSSQKVLLSASLDKLWAWGGLAGASKGVEDMVSQSAVAVAATAA